MNFFRYLLPLRRYKAKRVKSRCYQERVGHLEPRFQGEMVVPGEYFFDFYKTRHILLSDSANCTVLRAAVLTQYRRVTDGRTDGQTDRQTDGIAIASTALAMRALRCAVKTILDATMPKFTILWGHVKEILLLNKFFSDCQYVP